MGWIGKCWPIIDCPKHIQVKWNHIECNCTLSCIVLFMVFETWICIQIQSLFGQVSFDVNEKQYGKCFSSLLKVNKPIYFTSLTMHDHMGSCILWFVVINRTDLRPIFESRTVGVGLLKFQCCKTTNLKIHNRVVKLLTVWFSVWWFMQSFPTSSTFKRIHWTWDSMRDVVVCLVAYRTNPSYSCRLSSSVLFLLWLLEPL